MSDKESTAREIADEVGIGRVKVFKIAKQIGVPIAGRSEAQHGKLIEAIKEKPRRKPRSRGQRAKPPIGDAAVKASTPSSRSDLQGIGQAMIKVAEALEGLTVDARERVMRAISVLYTGAP